MSALHSIRQRIESIGMSLLMRGSGAVMAVIFSVIMAKFYSIEEVGSFFLMISFVEISSVVSRLGFPQVVAIRFGSLDEKKYKNDSDNILYNILLFVLILSLLSYIISCIIINYFYDQNSNNFLDLYYIFGLSVVPMSLYYVMSNALVGLGRLCESQFVMNIVCQALMLIILFVAILGNSYFLIVFGYLFSNIVALIVSILFVFFIFKKIYFNFDYKLIIKYLSQSIRYFVSVAILNFNSKISFFVLGYICGNVEVALYGVALKIASISSLILSAVDVAVCKKFAYIYANCEKKQIKKEYKIATCLLVIVTFPVMIIIYFFSNNILSLFGVQFADSVQVLRILLLGQIVNIITGPVGMLLAMCGQDKQLRNIYLITFPLYVVMLVQMTKHYGVNGAAVSVALNECIINIFSYLIARKNII